MSVLGALGLPTPSLNKIIALMALLVALIGIHIWDRGRAIENAVKQVHSEYQIENQKSALRAINERDRLVEEQAIERGIRDDKINALNIELNDALARLRTRPSRSEESGKPAENRNTCTGAELLREDAEFLVREASRADAVVVQRNYYFQQYERARQMIERINNE